MSSREPSHPSRRPGLSRLTGPLLEAVLASVDPDLLLDHVDVDGVVRRVDVNDLVARLEVDAVLASVDVNALLDRVDVNALLDRVEVNALLDRVDVDALLDRADVDRLLDRLDVDRLLDRVDVDGLVQRAGVPDILRDSTRGLAGSALDQGRRYVLALDVLLARAVQRLLRRDDDTATASLPEVPSADPSAPHSASGLAAGLVTRLLANALDSVVTVGSYTAVSAGVLFVLEQVFGVTEVTGAGPGWLAGAAAWSFLLLWVSLATTGRTPGTAIVGLRVLRRDGDVLPPWRCALRVLAVPLSATIFGLGWLGALLGRERRTLHDVVAGSNAVYDWGERAATVPTPLARWAARVED